MMRYVSVAEGYEDLHPFILRIPLKSSLQILNTRYEIPNKRSWSKQHTKSLSHTSIGYLPSSTSGDRLGSEEQEGDLLAGYLRRGSYENASGQVVEKWWERCPDGG
jgi:hypothetical protein